MKRLALFVMALFAVCFLFVGMAPRPRQRAYPARLPLLSPSKHHRGCTPLLDTSSLAC